MIAAVSTVIQLSLDSCLRLFLKECSRVATARRVSSQEVRTGDELLKVILKRDSCSFYSKTVDNFVYVPFQASLIAEPPIEARAVRLMDVLPAELIESYRDPAGLLRPPAEVTATLELFRGR